VGDRARGGPQHDRLGRQEYGKGTPAYAAVVMRAVELLAGHGLTPGGQRIGGTP
jgi:hypothetical protein